jgi:cytoskeleton protein RodZ
VLRVLFQVADRGNSRTVLQQHPSTLAETRDLMSAGPEPVPSQTAPGQTVPGPAGVGADLRAARQRLGWGLPDISAWLRIRLPYLEALEDGRVADLPGTAYAVGFLRTYGSALGLDADELSRRFRLEAADMPAKPSLTFPAPVPERSVPLGAVVLVGLVLAVGSYIGWYRLSGEGKLPAEVVAPVPARLAPLAEQAVPPSVPPRPIAPAPLAAAIPAPQPSAPMSSQPASAAISVPPSAAAAMSLPPPQPSALQPTADTTPLGTAPVAPATPAATVPANPDDSRITLRAKADDWLQVRDKSSGQVLLNRTLHAGDTWAVPSRPNLFLTVGNAGATEVLVDGNLVPSLGNAGVVRHDVPLDPDLLRDGKAAVAATPVSAHTSGQAPPAKPTAQ